VKQIAPTEGFTMKLSHSASVVIAMFLFFGSVLSVSIYGVVYYKRHVTDLRELKVCSQETGETLQILEIYDSTLTLPQMVKNLPVISNQSNRIPDGPYITVATDSMGWTLTGWSRSHHVAFVDRYRKKIVD
jgi:hypothetical protein